MLTKEEILSKADLKRVVVKVPEWGDAVTIQEMSARLRVQFETTLDENDPLLREKLVAMSVIDQDGSLMFTLDEAAQLAEKNYKAIKRISDAVLKLSRIRAAEVEDAEANFTATPGGG
jgi:hypothetical protein